MLTELQGLVTNWVAALAVALPFGYAFGAGMVAAVNPCGFVMLPAYLSLYLGLQEQEFSQRAALVRLGIWQLAGRGISAGVFEQLAERIGSQRSATFSSFFLFGLAYAAAS